MVTGGTVLQLLQRHNMSIALKELCETTIRQLDNVQSQMIALEFGQTTTLGPIRQKLVSLRQDLRFTLSLAKNSNAGSTSLSYLDPIFQALTREIRRLISLLPPSSINSSEMPTEVTKETWLRSWGVTFKNDEISPVGDIEVEMALSHWSINIENKHLLAQLKPVPSTVKLENLQIQYPDGEINRIVTTFAKHPFAIPLGSVQEDIKREGGLASVIQTPSMQMGRSWLAEVTTFDRSPLAVINAGIELYQRLWVNTVQILRQSELGWMAGQDLERQKYLAFQEQMDQALRDALLRQENDVHTTVFVGGQHSGKSTLINGLLECNVLPVGTGPTTSLPCRIIHTPGQVDPLLAVDSTAVNRNIIHIRNKGETWQQQTANQNDFPPGLKESLATFNDPNFELPCVAFTAERWINDAIRLSIIYSIPFGEFGFNTWAVLRMEIPSLKEAGRNQRFEFVDMPGITSEDSTEFNWQPLASEVVKTANVVVAVVASNNYDGSNWRDVPKVIDAGSNIRPTIIIATALDDVQRREQERVKRRYIEAFWPESKDDPTAVGVYLTCSAELGIAANILDKKLTAAEDKPIYNSLENPATNPGLSYLFWQREDTYNEFSRDQVIQLVKDLKRTSMLRETRDDFFRYLTTTSRIMYYSEEAKGLSLRLQRITTVIEDQMIQLGLSPRSPSEQKKAQAALRNKANVLRRTWAASERDVRRTYKSLVAGAAKTINDGMDEGFTNAIEQVSAIENILRDSGEDTAFIEFDSAASLQHFVESVQASIRTRLLKLQEEAIASLREEAKAAYHAQIASVLELATDFDPRAEQELKQVESISSFQKFESMPDKTIDIDLVMSRKRIKPRPTEFELMQERVLKSLTKSYQPNSEGTTKRSLETLSPLLRALLAVVSFLPFALRYPFTSRIPSSTRYRLDLSALRRRFKEIILQTWVDQFSRELQRKLQQPGGVGTMILEEAISSAINAGKTRYQSALDTKPAESDPAIVQAIVSNYCNFTAAQEALDGISLVLQGEETI
ncbi:hypothetical protein FRB91_003239 [Serendipita sp. 411]|nr:hypothetical protein FRB91_003239 [Serendipita sp. 411]